LPQKQEVFDFWENSDEDVCQDYLTLKPYKKMKIDVFDLIKP